MTSYSVPCAVCGIPVPVMTERRQAKLCAETYCRSARRQQQETDE